MNFFEGLEKRLLNWAYVQMGENRDGYSGKRKGKGAVCPKMKKGYAPFGAFSEDTGQRDDLKNQNR